MTKFPRLFRRNHTYYIRVAVPQTLINIVKKSEIKYSLYTNNYNTALIRWRHESAKIDAYFAEIIKGNIDMKLKNNQLILEKNDIDKIATHRFEEAIRWIEDNEHAIIKGKKNSDDFSIFSTKNQELDEYMYFDEDNNDEITFKEREYKENRIIRYLTKYVSELKDDSKVSSGIKDIANQVIKKNAYMSIISNDEENRFWLPKLNILMQEVENNIVNRINSIINNTIYKGGSMKTNKLYDIADNNLKENIKNYEHLTKTPWKELAEELYQKKLRDGTKKQTIEDARPHLVTCFELLQKEYIEDITYEDCEKFTKNIYKLPSNRKKIYKDTNIFEAIKLCEKNNGALIKKKTVSTYMNALDELLDFGVDKGEHGIIPKNHMKKMDKPKDKEIKKDGKMRENFSEDELKKLFSPHKYQNPKSIKYEKYWIPLIGLYQGMRENEICQLYADNIQKIDGTWCFHIFPVHETQQFKNDVCLRNVPIHKTLLELGFLDLCKRVKKHGNVQLFSNLTLNSRGKYNKKLSDWWNRTYMKDIKPKKESKIKLDFHSLRHTFRTIAGKAIQDVNCVEYLAGWDLSGSQSELYNHIGKDLKYLKKQLDKVKFPIDIEGLKAKF